MKKIPIYLGAIFVLGLLLSGCAAGGESQTLLEYRRSGGFAGFDDQLVIDTTGKVTVRQRGGSKEYNLDADTISDLQALIEDARFTELENEYLPTGAGADFIEYTITFDEQTVRAVDTAIPMSLLPVIDYLNQLIERNE